MRQKNCSLDTRHFIETLEARALFSAYVYGALNDEFDLPRVIHDLAPGLESLGYSNGIGIGDIDGDGYDDFALAEGGLFGSLLPPSSVHLFSGRDASVIRILPSGGYGFGSSMFNLGDVNDDDIPDLLIGAPGYDGTDNDVDDPTGRAYIYSGADGALLRTFEGTTPGAGFGMVVSRLNDANEDGIQDLIIGAPGYYQRIIFGNTPPLPLINGEVFIFSGADGSLIRSHVGEQPGDHFGGAIAVTPDEGNDRQYFAIGASQHTSDGSLIGAGRVYVFTLDGTQAYTLDGARTGDAFGAAVAISAARFDLSEPPENTHRLIVGAPGSDYGAFEELPPIEDQGRIESFLLSTGTYRVIGAANDASVDATMGSRIVVIGDLDYDGRNDLLVTAAGAQKAYSFNASAQSFNNFGSSLANPVSNRIGTFLLGFAGDVNDDGIFDVLTNSPEGHVTVVSSLGLGNPITIGGTSDDLRYMWASFNIPILFIDGVARAFGHVPGLVQSDPGDAFSFGSVINAVANDGTIYFHNQSVIGERSDLMVLRDGVAVTFESLVTSVIGEPVEDFSALSAVRVGTGGHVLLSTGADFFPVSNPPSTFVFIDGELTRLWTGAVYDVNASGTVVGTTFVAGQPSQSVIWSAQSGMTAIPELTGSLGINDLGMVVGTRTGTPSPISGGMLATWSDSVLADLGSGQSGIGANSFASWAIVDFANDGRVLARLALPSQRGPTNYITYIYEPDADGLRRLVDATHASPGSAGLGDATGFGVPAPAGVLAPDGRIFTGAAFLDPITNSAVGTLREDSPIAAASIGSFHYTAGINQFNELVVFFRQGDNGDWQVRRISGAPIAPGVTQLAMFTDEGTGLAYVSLANGTSVQVFSTNPGITEFGHKLSGFDGRTAIVSGFTVFTNSVGIVHMAGFDESGDLVIYHRIRGLQPASGASWAFDNITDNHLTPQSFETPAIVSSLTAYVTPWHGMNLAGIDSDGHVQAIWWAPGSLFWRVDDISEAVAGENAGGGFIGELTAFVTPWGTMHINGTPNQVGHVGALWWSPSTGWRGAGLNSFGPTLMSESLTSFVTPWGGLSVVGITSTGTRAIVVYWWSLESQQWGPEVLPAMNSNLRFDGRLTSLVEVTDIVTQNIYARSEEGELYRLSWRPDGNPWTAENITDLLG